MSDLADQHVIVLRQSLSAAIDRAVSAEAAVAALRARMARLEEALKAVERLPLMRERGESDCPYCYFAIPGHASWCEWMAVKEKTRDALKEKP